MASAAQKVVSLQTMSGAGSQVPHLGFVWPFAFFHGIFLLVPMHWTAWPEAADVRTPWARSHRRMLSQKQHGPTRSLLALATTPPDPSISKRCGYSSWDPPAAAYTGPDSYQTCPSNRLHRSFVAAFLPAQVPRGHPASRHCCALLDAINFRSNLPVVVVDTGGQVVIPVRANVRARMCTCGAAFAGAWVEAQVHCHKPDVILWWPVVVLHWPLTMSESAMVFDQQIHESDQLTSFCCALAEPPSCLAQLQVELWLCQASQFLKSR